MNGAKVEVCAPPRGAVAMALANKERDGLPRWVSIEEVIPRDLGPERKNLHHVANHDMGWIQDPSACLPTNTTFTMYDNTAINERNEANEEALCKAREHEERVKLFSRMVEGVDPWADDEVGRNVSESDDTEDEDTPKNSRRRKKNKKTSKGRSSSKRGGSTTSKQSASSNSRKNTYSKFKRKRKNAQNAATANDGRGVPGKQGEDVKIPGIRPFAPFVTQKMLERSNYYYQTPGFICKTKLVPNKPHHLVRKYFDEAFEARGLGKRAARELVPDWAIEPFDRHVRGWLWRGRNHHYVWYPHEIGKDEDLCDYSIYCTLVSRVAIIEELIANTKIPLWVRAHLIMIEDAMQMLILFMDKTKRYKDEDLILPAVFDRDDYTPYTGSGAERCGFVSPQLIEMWCMLSDSMQEARKLGKMPKYSSYAQAERGVTTYYDLFMPRYELIFHQGEIPDLSLFIPYIGLHGRSRKHSIPYKDRDMLEYIELLMKAIGQPMKLRFFHAIAAEKARRIPWVCDSLQRLIFAALGGYYWINTIPSDEPSTSYYVRRMLYNWFCFEPPTVEEFCSWIEHHKIPDATGTLGLRTHHKHSCLNCVKLGIFIVIDTNLPLRHVLEGMCEHAKMRNNVYSSMREARLTLDRSFYGVGNNWEQCQRTYDRNFLAMQRAALNSIVEATIKKQMCDARRKIKQTDPDGSNSGKKKRKPNVASDKMRIIANIVMPRQPISSKSRSDDDETIDRLIEECEAQYRAQNLEIYEETMMENELNMDQIELLSRIQAGRILKQKVPRDRRHKPEPRLLYVKKHYACTRGVVLRYILDFLYRSSSEYREGRLSQAPNYRALSDVLIQNDTWAARKRWETEYAHLGTFNTNDWSVDGVLHMLYTHQTLRNYAENAVDFSHSFSVLFWPDINGDTTVREALGLMRDRAADMILYLWGLLGIRNYDGKCHLYRPFDGNDEMVNAKKTAYRCFDLYAGMNPEWFVDSDHRNITWVLHGRSIVENGKLCICPHCSGEGVTVEGEYREFQKLIARNGYRDIVMGHVIVDSIEHLLQTSYTNNLQYMYRTGGMTFARCLVRSFEMALEDRKNDADLVKVSESITESERLLLAGIAAHTEPWRDISFMWMALPPLNCEWEALQSLASAKRVYESLTYPVDTRSVITSMMDAYKRTAWLLGTFAHERDIRTNTRVYSLPFHWTLRQIYTGHERFNIVEPGQHLPPVVGRLWYCPYHVTVNAGVVNLHAKNHTINGMCNVEPNKHSLSNVGAVSAMGPMQVALEAGGQNRVFCDPTTKRSKARARGHVHSARMMANQNGDGSAATEGDDVASSSSNSMDREHTMNDDSILGRAFGYSNTVECNGTIAGDADDNDDDDDDNFDDFDDDDDDDDGDLVSDGVLSKKSSKKRDKQRRYRKARLMKNDSLCNSSLTEINLIGKLLVLYDKMYALCVYCLTPVLLCRENYALGAIACGVCTAGLEELMPKKLSPYLRFRCYACNHNRLYEAHEVASYVVWDDTKPLTSPDRGWRRIFLCSTKNTHHNLNYIGKIPETLMLSTLSKYIHRHLIVVWRYENINGVMTQTSPYLVSNNKNQLRGSNLNRSNRR